MCSEYQVTTTQERIDAALRQRLVNTIQQTSWDLRVKLTAQAPMIEAKGHDLVLSDGVFPAQPFPNARLSGIDDRAPDAGDDKQIRRIYDLPTWKKSFTHSRCLIPMTSFFEPVYWGEHAGAVMRFRPPDADVFFVPAIRVPARVPKSDRGFSLLTHTASPQMLKYHHRLLVLLEPAKAIEWVRGEPRDPQQAFEFLLENRQVPELDVQRERQMAKGWEKRVDTHKSSLAAEQNYRQTLKTEGVRG